MRLESFWASSIVFSIILGFLFSNCAIRGQQRMIITQPDSATHNRLMPFITIQAKVSYQTPTGLQGGHLQIRIQRDSLIWFSLRHAIGLEVVRGLITPQTVKWINRLEKCYEQHDYKTLGQQLHIHCHYALLQAILLNEWPEEANTGPKEQQGEKDTRQSTWSVGYSYKQNRQFQTLIGLQARIGPRMLHMTYQAVTFSKKLLNFPFKVPDGYVALSTKYE
jgi:hypothetical protein